MEISGFEWRIENEWLQKVLKEVQKQYDENRNYKENFKRDYIKTQREMWQDIGAVSISNGLEQITDFIQLINTTKMQKRSHEFVRRLEEKYERMLSSPYFGRIDFIENGQEKAVKFKTSLEFVNILKQFVSYLNQQDRSFTDIVYKGTTIVSSKDISELFYKDYVRLPIKSRLQKIKNRILYLADPYKKERIDEVAAELYETGSYIDRTEIMEHSAAKVRDEMKAMFEEIDRMTGFDLADIYGEMIENLESFAKHINIEYDMKEINEIKVFTLENLKNRILCYEDQLALLYLKGVTGDLPRTDEIKYVIIDEAQDYTPLQYEIIHQLFQSANITMLGDLNQSINPYMNLGDYKNIAHIFPEDSTCMINLTRSYRSTMEITEFSRKLLNKEASYEYVERSGDAPVLLSFSDENEIKERLLRDIEKYKKKGYKSIGIITRTEKQAREVYNSINEKVNVKAIFSDDDEYVSDTLVIPSYLAKGLEFDAVIIFNAGDGNYCREEERLLLYTALTRALHVLCIYYTGQITPLLKEAAS